MDSKKIIPFRNPHCFYAVFEMIDESAIEKDIAKIVKAVGKTLTVGITKNNNYIKVKFNIKVFPKGLEFIDFTNHLIGVYSKHSELFITTISESEINDILLLFKTDKASEFLTIIDSSSIKVFYPEHNTSIVRIYPFNTDIKTEKNYTKISL